MSVFPGRREGECCCLRPWGRGLRLQEGHTHRCCNEGGWRGTPNVNLVVRARAGQGPRGLSSSHLMSAEKGCYCPVFPAFHHQLRQSASVRPARGGCVEAAGRRGMWPREDGHAPSCYGVTAAQHPASDCMDPCPASESPAGHSARQELHSGRGFVAEGPSPTAGTGGRRVFIKERPAARGQEPLSFWWLRDSCAPSSMAWNCS